MNLKQALKKKNKLAGDLKLASVRMIEHNTKMDGQARPYDSFEQMSLMNGLASELAELKTKIQLANTPVLHLIYEMAELKNIIAALQRMTCAEGPEYNYRNDNVINMTSIISVRKRDEMVTALENRIEEINDELDKFNALTEI